MYLHFTGSRVRRWRRERAWLARLSIGSIPCRVDAASILRKRRSTLIRAPRLRAGRQRSDRPYLSLVGFAFLAAFHELQAVRRRPADGRPARAVRRGHWVLACASLLYECSTAWVTERLAFRSRCGRAAWVSPTANVRANRAPTVGRQARAGENVPCTAGPGLVACRWCSG